MQHPEMNECQDQRSRDAAAEILCPKTGVPKQGAKEAQASRKCRLSVVQQEKLNEIEISRTQGDQPHISDPTFCEKRRWLGWPINDLSIGQQVSESSQEANASVQCMGELNSETVAGRYWYL